MCANPSLSQAIERVKRWMTDHDAPLLVENLADGATSDVLARAESTFGFALPDDVRALWSQHNGQRRETNGFVESYDLFDADRAYRERRWVALALDFLRQHPEMWPASGGEEREIMSDRWVPLAGRDTDQLVVSAVTGRVFRCRKDAPPLRVSAGSVTAWFEAYATQVEAGNYSVEPGFGTYFLAGW